MEKKIRLGAFSLYGIFYLSALFIRDVHYYSVGFIANHVVYRPEYYMWYISSPLALLVLPLFSRRREVNSIMVFISTILVFELVYKKGLEVYFQAPLFLAIDGLFVSVVMAVLLIINTIKPLNLLRPIEVFFITISAAMLSFFPHVIYLIYGATQKGV